jgi:hypothetical protein
MSPRELHACTILDEWINSTTRSGRQIAASMIIFALRHGDISERVFDRYWTQLNGYEVAA